RAISLRRFSSPDRTTTRRRYSRSAPNKRIFRLKAEATRSQTNLAAWLHGAEFEQAAGPGGAVGLKPHRHLRLAARERIWNLVFPVEQFRRMVFEALGDDLFAVDENVEDAALSFA